jgi:hypothetical protein
MKSYACITFGKEPDNTIWCYSSRDYRYKSHADKFGLNEICNAAVMGYYVIEEGEDYWEVVEEYNTNNMSIGYDYRKGYNVQPAPKLQFV